MMTRCACTAFTAAKGEAEAAPEVVDVVPAYTGVQSPPSIVCTMPLSAPALLSLAAPKSSLYSGRKSVTSAKMRMEFSPVLTAGHAARPAYRMHALKIQPSFGAVNSSDKFAACRKAMYYGQWCNVAHQRQQSPDIAAPAGGSGTGTAPAGGGEKALVGVSGGGPVGVGGAPGAIGGVKGFSVGVPSTGGG